MGSETASGVDADSIDARPASTWRPPLAVSPSRTSVVLAKALLRQMHEDGLEHGDPLPSEAVMARQFAVGKGSLREALLILEVNGFISVRAGAKGGPVVRDGGATAFGQMASMHFQRAKAEVRDLLQARVALEPFVARLAAEAQDPRRMSPLIALIDESATIDTSDSRAYLSCSNRFHKAVASLSGNKVLDMYGAAIQDLYESRLPGPLTTPGPRRERTMKEHITIGKAIVAGESAKAERLMRAHMEHLASEIAERHTDLLEEVVVWE